LRALKSLSNHDPGFGGRNDFYILSKEFLRRGTVKEFRAMPHDRNPVVRAMGMLCLAQTDADEHYLTLLLHTNDEAEVYLHEGCIISKITVGEFARRLLSNPYFLDPEGKRPAVLPPPDNGMHPTADTLPVIFGNGSGRRVMPSGGRLL
jgi:hypothetical protein